MISCRSCCSSCYCCSCCSCCSSSYCRYPCYCSCYRSSSSCCCCCCRCCCCGSCLFHVLIILLRALARSRSPLRRPPPRTRGALRGRKATPGRQRSLGYPLGLLRGARGISRGRTPADFFTAGAFRTEASLRAIVLLTTYLI